MKNEKHLIYSGDRFEKIDIDIQNYNNNYFSEEMKLESETFYKIRKMNNILPYKIEKSEENEKENIKKYFEKNKDNFYI